MRTPEPSSGRRRYRVHEVLGRGGFGTVYRADLLGDDGFTKEVALKVMSRGGPDRADHLARLRDEARMLGLVRHRALVRVDALVRLDGCPCIVMERIDGASLDELLVHAGPLPVPTALEIVAEVAAALFAAYHTEVDGRPLRLLHRDIKPSNVHITPAGDCKLLDFGVARAEFDTREARTHEVLYGSPAYMSPERLELADSPAGDVFALGITLAEIVSGRRAGAVAARPAQHEERVSRLLVATDDELRPLVTRMLAYDPGDRPDAEAVERECRALVERLPGTRLREWAAERVAAASGRSSTNGELSGRILAEEVDPSPRKTWDEFELPKPTLPAPVVTRPPPPARRRFPWLPVLILGTLAAVLLGTGLLAVAVTSMVVAIWPGVSGTACVSMVDEMGTRLARVSAPPRAKALSDRARAACLRGDLGLINADLLLMHVQNATDDGEFDDADLKDLERIVDQRVGPEQP